MNASISQGIGSVTKRIRDYLCSGGLFNPELADHNKVRDLLMAAREEIERLNGIAWDCRGSLRRFEMEVREEIRNGGMTQATRVILARHADRADEAEKAAMTALNGSQTT